MATKRVSRVSRARGTRLLCGLVGLAMAAVLASCGSSVGTTPARVASAKVSYVKNGTFTFAVADDPGNLDPLESTQTTAVNLFRFLYDPLIHVGANGKIVSGLASSWKVDGAKVTFTLRQGATCSDGSAVTPAVVAEDFNFIKNPANASPLIGTFLPNADYTVTTDASANTVTLNLSQPFGFILESLSLFPIVCGAGAVSPTSLSETASGSGPYVLTQAVPGDHYTLARRAGYEWGPGGASNSASGSPKAIVMKIVANETTAANLLLSGGLNAAVIDGPNHSRIHGSGYSYLRVVSGGVMMMFNETTGHPTADPTVRKAITMALNRGDLASIVTEGLDPTPSHSIAPAEPQACPDSAAAASIPSYNLASAKKLLTADGWKVGSNGIRSKDGETLSLTAPYLSTAAGNLPGMELAASELQKLGVHLTLDPITEGTLSQILFGTANYDIWPLLALSVPLPSTLVGLFSGPAPPDGINPAHIDNAKFNSLTAKALQTSGSAGCSLWVSAEKALFSRPDVVPMAAVVTNWELVHSSLQTFEGRITPTSIRLLKS